MENSISSVVVDILSFRQKKLTTLINWIYFYRDRMHRRIHRSADYSSGVELADDSTHVSQSFNNYSPMRSDSLYLPPLRFVFYIYPSIYLSIYIYKSIYLYAHRWRVDGLESLPKPRLNYFCYDRCETFMVSPDPKQR